MSWQRVMERVLPPIRTISPKIGSEYGAVAGRKPPSTIPHRGTDFNYAGGPHNGINRTHPPVHAPVTGTVVNAGEGTVGSIAIRDANGFLHELLHTGSQTVRKGQQVFAGQPIGTMGNTGTEAHHVHYQMKDPNGAVMNPTAFWDRQGGKYDEESQRYQNMADTNVANGFAGTPTAQIDPDASGRRIDSWSTGRPITSGLPISFNGRFGNWSASSPDGSVVSPAPPPAPVGLAGLILDHIRRINGPGQAASPPSASVFDSGAPPVPFVPDDGENSFADRFGDRSPIRRVSSRFDRR